MVGKSVKLYFLFDDSNLTFLQLGAAMMEVKSCDAFFAGNRTEVPKSHSTAFTFGRCRHCT